MWTVPITNSCGNTPRTAHSMNFFYSISNEPALSADNGRLHAIQADHLLHSDIDGQALKMAS
jgi:hypothetical protein